jgi:protein-tyrosine-phosphatase
VHVTFVCEVNQARSPVAAVLFAAELARRSGTDAVPAGWTVDSAGVFATPDVPAMPRMRELAARRGLDLSEHRARALDVAAIDAADLLLTMTRAQADVIGLRAEGVVTRCFVLAELVALLDALVRVPVPDGSPEGTMTVVGLPDTAPARVLAAHGRRPFRPRDETDDVGDPLPGSGMPPEVAFGRLEQLVGALAGLLLDDAPSDVRT